MKIKIHLLPALICGAIVAVSPALFAGDASPSPAASPATSGTTAPDGEHHHHLDIMEKLKTDLNLTQDQVDKIKPILEDRRQKMMALRQDATLSGEQKRDKAKDILQSSNEQIKAILTPDQAKKFEDIMQQMREHHGRGEQGPQPSPQQSPQS